MNQRRATEQVELSELTERAVGMLKLGITLLHSGAMFRNVAELDEAVAVLESAEKHPDGSADRSLVLTSLGNAGLSAFCAAPAAAGRS